MQKTLKKMTIIFGFAAFFCCQNFASGLGEVSVSENRIVNVRDPIDKTDAATKNYVDNKIEGIEKPPAVLQTEGQSETAVMSQKAVSSIVSKQRESLQEHIDKTVDQKLIDAENNKVDPNDITLKTGMYIPKNIHLPRNDMTGVLENKVVYNSDGSLSYILQYFYSDKENESWKRTYNTYVYSTIVNDWTDWINTSENAVFNRIYPVGSIYISVNSVNPSSLFGGVWSAWSQGRVPVGTDTDDDDFDYVEKTGGEKTHKLTVGEMPSHRHGILMTTQVGSTPWGATTTFSNGESDYNPNYCAYSGNGLAHNNLQPYITCYMWKRIA